MAYRQPFEIEPPFLIFGHHPALWFRLCAILGGGVGIALGASFVVNYQISLRTNPDFLWPRSNFVLFAEGMWFGFLIFIISLITLLLAWGVVSLWHRIRR